MIVSKCPICKRSVKLGGPFSPFCSERCKLIDLGNWASEKYVVSTPARPEELEDLEERSGSSEDEEPNR